MSLCIGQVTRDAGLVGLTVLQTAFVASAVVRAVGARVLAAQTWGLLVMAGCGGQQ